VSDSTATPPGFCENAKWVFLKISFHLGDEERTAIVARGMPVHEQLHGFYWKERAAWSSMLGAVRKADARIAGFILTSHGGATVGYGAIPDDVGADQLAWLSCFFAEMDHLKISLIIEAEKEIDASGIVNGCIDRKTVH
jgi:hypothetical protein